MRPIIATKRWRSDSHRVGVAVLLGLTLACSLLGPTLAAPQADAMTLTVQKANMLAEQGNYAAAIPLYEQAVAKLPANQQLKKNLAVIYTNRAIELQQAQKFDEAEALLKKADNLLPGDHQIQRARAGNAYSRMQQLLAANSTDFATQHRLADQAIALDPAEKAFKSGKASVYMAEAQTLIDQEQLEAAIEKVKQAHSVAPDMEGATRSLVSLSLGVASRTEDKAKREQYLQQALAADPSAETQRKVEQLRKAMHPGLIGKLDKGREAAISAVAPGRVVPQTLADMLSDIEKQLSLTGTGPDGKPLPVAQRLEAAERQVYGKVGDGGMSLRAKQLYGDVFGGVANGATEQNWTGFAQAHGGETYIEDVFHVTEGKVIRWARFPLRVYIDEPKKVEHFHPGYIKAVDAALAAWKRGSNGFVDFVPVKNKDASDIRILWADTAYEDRFDDDSGAKKTNYDALKPPKPSPVSRVLQIASMVTPGYFSLLPQAANAAVNYTMLKQLQVIIDESTLTIGLKQTETMTPEQAQAWVQAVLTHEIGHALGIKGHSHHTEDLMAERPVSQKTPPGPTLRDLNTLREIYSRKADLVLNLR